MSYNVVLGDMGPTMPLGLTDDGGPFVLAPGDVVVLRYYGIDMITHEISLTVTNAATGACEAAWGSGDLPVIGVYRGLVRVTRVADSTFPRTFPNDGSKILWWVHATI